ncbi:UNVERIFIED_CONTAM: hypothetical protein PYX00_009679 [Menopon gallinae]|uniref:Integrase catalytic domain-containing protein n=1 Tax=Menopon gallinae TaxID=328185 RepID=A0AAW2HC98_9NEOP
MGVTPVTGADTLEEALELKRQLGTLLMAGGFELAKWASNSGELAPNAPRNHVLSDGTVKTLGLHWNPAFDVFGFQDQLEDHSKTITNEKHPVILSAKSSFTKLLVLDFHRRTLHGGPQLTLGQLRRQSPLMGQLPANKVTPSRPFLLCGLDYAGPVLLRPTKGRCHITLKGYVALFVCMSTKATHLEVVSDCSTSAFLAAFKRFAARRGIPATLCSDQATTFKGAEAELKSLLSHAFTKFVWLHPTKTTTAREVIDRLEVQRKYFGNPSNIISDRGSAFTSAEFGEYCRNNDIKHHTVTTGLPRANGQVERINSTIISTLTKMAIDDPSKWYKYVDDVMRGINSTYQRSIDTTPFELMTGVPMKTSNRLNKIREIIAEEVQKDFEHSRDALRKKAKEQIGKVQEENRRRYIWETLLKIVLLVTLFFFLMSGIVHVSRSLS